MFVIHTIPISRGITKDHLSYFSKTNLVKGTIVSIPIRGRVTPAIVEGTEPVADLKTKLRTAPYQIKKVKEVKGAQVFSPEFMNAVREMADHTAGTVGSVLNSLVPKAVLDEPQVFETKRDARQREKTPIAYERLVLQSDHDERFATYKSLIRESFARKQSIFICMPTLHDVEQFVTQSETGIRAYMFAFHSGLTKKVVRERWNRALKEKHPVAIVGTGIFLAIPREDIHTFVIERESTGAYKSQVRPFVDIRTFADLLAREMRARVVFADSFLRIETLYHFYEGKFVELAPLRFRPLSPARCAIVDMKNYKPTIKGRYEILSRELRELIENTKRGAEHLFIFNARRGLSPMTVCSDCGATVTSSSSDMPMVLHKTSRGNIFFCHQNGEIRNAAERCRFCGGWKLVALGGGIQLVEEQIREQFPDTHLVRIDSDVTNTHKKAFGAAESWRSRPGSILLGTEMALPYLEPIENMAVSSIDALLSIPDFKIETKVFSILLTLRSLSQKNFLLQTRNPEQQVLKDAAQGNLLEFYRREIGFRKKLGYPPFSLFIKLTVSGTKQAVASQMEFLEEIFAVYDIRIFSAFLPAQHGKQTSHALLSIPPHNWPHTEILQKLRQLPPQITIKVEPESLL